MKKARLSHLLFIGINILIVFFLVIPAIIIVISSFSAEPYVVFPPKSLSLRWYHNFFRSIEFTSALKISFLLALACSFCSLLIGIPASIALVRLKFRGREFLNSLFLSPITFPGIVLGIAILMFYSKYSIQRGFLGLLFAHMVITIPFVIKMISGSLYADIGVLEEAAQSLGATPAKTFFVITLPLIKSGVIAAGIFAYIISFDELVITIFLAGPRTATLPIRIFSYLEYTSDPTIAAISTVLIVIVGLIVTLLPKKYLFLSY
jgi:ABC-type spermidine/putrescine transport system permease subunit II